VIIPENPKVKDEYLKWILGVCLDSKKDRKDLYDRRRQFFLYGTSQDQQAYYNRIESHLDLVCSFLYSPDHAEFSLSAPANASDDQVKQFMAAQHSTTISATPACSTSSPTACCGPPSMTR
jgi:hypothetical protein